MKSRLTGRATDRLQLVCDGKHKEGGMGMIDTATQQNPDLVVAAFQLV